MNRPSFTSLIVTYNSGSEILDLLDDLLLHAPEHKIIVIDNASNDETAMVVQEQFPQVVLIQNSTNVGYARAVNQGFTLCDTEFVLLLNPDIRIDSSEIFREMQRCLRQSRTTAAVAPLQFKNENEKPYLNFTWSYYTGDAFKVYLSYLFEYEHEFHNPIPVTFLNAGCLLIRRAAFEQVGRLNEKYFMYGEEPDLFLKFRRYGLECYLLPNIGVTHYRERSVMTRPILQRLQLRYYSARNVCDAFIHGWANLLLDVLALKQTQFRNRKRRTTYRKRPSSNIG